MNQGLVLMPVSPGELLDRLTILNVKQDKLDGDKQIAALELSMELHEVADPLLDKPGVSLVADQLYEINTQLWEVEDHLRAADGQVFPITVGRTITEETVRYCSLARLVYNLNDQRCGLKRELDEMLGGVVEPKQYAEYERSHDRGRPAEESDQEEGHQESGEEAPGSPRGEPRG